MPPSRYRICECESDTIEICVPKPSGARAGFAEVFKLSVIEWYLRPRFISVIDDWLRVVEDDHILIAIEIKVCIDQASPLSCIGQATGDALVCEAAGAGVEEEDGWVCFKSIPEAIGFEDVLRPRHD